MVLGGGPSEFSSLLIGNHLSEACPQIIRVITKTKTCNKTLFFNTHNPSEMPSGTCRAGVPAYPERARTCKDGLVHSQRGGLDGGDPDVCWHLVTNYSKRTPQKKIVS